jgi:hypothetical protein
MTYIYNNTKSAPMDEAIDFILNQKDINISEEDVGHTMLHCSCWRNDGLPLVELLLYLGIDKDKKDNEDLVALDFA